MKRKKRKSSYAALAIGCMLCLIFLTLYVTPGALPRFEPLGSAPDAPAETPAPSEHVHSFDPESGICAECGAVCGHDGGFGEDDRCLICGWLCPHVTHSQSDASCPVCGKQFCHHFGMDGICDVCGAEAPIFLGELPDRYFYPAAHEGRHYLESITTPLGQEDQIAVWLPWDYSEDVKYNVVLLIHGDGGSCDDWTDAEERTYRGDIQFYTVYDNICEEHLCDPFIIIGLNNRGMENSFYGERFIKECVLPHVARSYSTWMEGDSPEQIAAAREHIAIGGLSRGSIYTYSVGMCRCLDVAANFCCFSNGYTEDVPRRLRSAELKDYGYKSYIATVGLKDEYVYVRAHRHHYNVLCTTVDALTDGENARMFEIDAGHNFITWTASLYDALLLMF